MNKISELPKTTFHKKLFLKNFARTGRLYESAELTGVCAKTVDLWKNKDKEFLSAYEGAKQKYIEMMEAEADRRAIGSDVTKASDLLMIFRLKALAPDKYRERQELTGKNGAPFIPSVIQVISPAAKALTEQIIAGKGTE